MRCPDRAWVTQALEAGFLHGIVLAATVGSRKIDEQLEYYLTTMLPPVMVYRSILLAMAGDWVNNDDPATSPPFRHSRIFQHWEKFAPLALERLQLCKYFSLGTCKVSRACDNTKVRPATG